MNLVQKSTRLDKIGEKQTIKPEFHSFSEMY